VSAALGILERLLDDLRGPLYREYRGRPDGNGQFHSGIERAWNSPEDAVAAAMTAVNRARVDLARARLNGETL